MRELLLWLMGTAWSSPSARTAMRRCPLARHQPGLCCLLVRRPDAPQQMLCETQQLTRQAQMYRERAVPRSCLSLQACASIASSCARHKVSAFRHSSACRGNEGAPPVREQHTAYLIARRLQSMHPLRQCGAATVAWAGGGPLHRDVPCLGGPLAASQLNWCRGASCVIYACQGSSGSSSTGFR